MSDNQLLILPCNSCLVINNLDLFFRAKYGVEEMCRDQWNWAKNNPWGYSKKP